ncbi:MAG: UbiX family flavin prenyltransferase [Chitinivibrionales bacterium]|nr:UbiX family flavin prenyltransferase [Chitinivibrionales bacterium]
MKRLIIGITGASGSVYTLRLLEAIRHSVETHLIVSPAAEKVLKLETGQTLENLKKTASFTYDYWDLGAKVSSGSFKTDGMIIVPCSIKSLSAVANSFADSLLVRAADVTLKERRRLVLAVRETPLHAGHLDLMQRATGMGAIVCPLCPGFYHHPQSLNDLADQMVGKILDLFDLENPQFKRWEGQRNDRQREVLP